MQFTYVQMSKKGIRKTCKILIVEDDKNTAKLIKIATGSAGNEAFLAENGMLAVTYGFCVLI
ncbi:response regulator [Paenibacillus sp. GYB006]|uniref:response regulator n=1 Tax=Paenibacillus sp. GYB006 TaxID=2994394 RepID=UPI002F96C212